MGMFDTVHSAAHAAASQIPAAATPPAPHVPAVPTAATPPADKPPQYVRGKDLDVDNAKDAGARAPNLVNAHNAYPIIEFIHFGNVHHSHSNLFVHEEYVDNENDDSVKKNSRPRGVQFRSGLEREAILLSVFMECAQTVLDEHEKIEEREKNDGLPGASGPARAPHAPAHDANGNEIEKVTSDDLNTHIQKVVSATKPVLPDDITYTHTHQAGMEYHQARANYRKLLRKIVDEKPAVEPPGGPLGRLPGPGSVPATFASLVDFTKGVAFKPQDVKVKFFALVAQQTEPQIEWGANAMTLKAIKDLANPFLPVWMLDDPAEEDVPKDHAPGHPLQHAAEQFNPFGAPTHPAAPAPEVHHPATGGIGDVKSFLEKSPAKPAPGTDPLGIVFKNPPEQSIDKKIVPMKTGDVAARAFLKVLGLKPPLGLPEKMVTAVVGIALEFTKAVYQSILVRDGTRPITPEALLKAALHDGGVGKKLEALAVSHLKSLQDARKKQTPTTVGIGAPLDQSSAEFDALINDRLKPSLEPAIKHAMDALADALELARQNGITYTSHTMEWYLGRLPWVQCSLFCHLFFPFWTALMRCAPAVVDSSTGSALKMILDAADKAKGIVETGHGMVAHADAPTMVAQPSKSPSGGRGGMFDSPGVAALVAAASQKPSTAGGPSLDQGKFVVAVKDRDEKGTGQTIPKSEYDKVKANHQWDGAEDAPEKGEDDNDDAGSGKAAFPS